MGATRIIVGFCVLAFSVMSVWSGDAIDASIATPVGEAASNSLPSFATLFDIEPWIHGDMPEDMKARLQAGFVLAAKKVQEVPECRGLFDALDADATEILRTGLYFPIASHRREKAVCGRAVAYTGYRVEPDFTAYRGWETVPTW